MSDIDNQQTSADKLIHQINSHLTVINGYVQLLQESITTPPQSDWMGKIMSESQRLIEKLEELKQLSKENQSTTL